jgi:hypothetical protein
MIPVMVAVVPQFSLRAWSCFTQQNFTALCILMLPLEVLVQDSCLSMLLSAASYWQNANQSCDQNNSGDCPFAMGTVSI